MNSWQIIYKLVSAPSGGQIIADGSVSVTYFTQQQVDLGLISYKNNGNASGDDNFNFTVSDGMGGSIGQSTFTINVIPKDNLTVEIARPIYTDPIGQYVLHPLSDGGIQLGTSQFSTFTTTPGHVTLLSSDILSSTDAGVDPINITYTVKDLPTNANGDAASILVGQWGTPDSQGYSAFSGYGITETDIKDGFDSTFTQAEINAGDVYYYDTGDVGGAIFGTQYTFSVSASDNAGNTVADLNVPVVVQRNGLLSDGVFYPANGAINIEASVPIGETTTLGKGVLTYVSPQFSDSQISYYLADLPTYGQLLLNGTPLVKNQEFSQADIDSGKLSYLQSGAAVQSDTVVFRVTDPNYPGLTASAALVESRSDNERYEWGASIFRNQWRRSAFAGRWKQLPFR